MEYRICKQCGEQQPLSAYRQYYGGSQGHYRLCKQCECVNSRFKYLSKKLKLGTLRKGEAEELDQIKTLYEYQRAAGLKPPMQQHQKHLDIGSMIDKYSNRQPPELSNWLTAELTEEPSVYMGQVYEELLSKYRPIKSINQKTHMPVYDETYDDVLKKILERFYEYEDKYYED